MSRAKYAGFCKYNHVSSTEAQARTETGRESGTGTGTGREVVCVDTKAARTTDFSNDIDVFAAVLLVVLPQFLMKSRHVRDLWETLMSLWGYIFYTSNPALYVSDTSAVDPAVPSSSSSFSSSSSSESVSADIALKVINSSSSSSSKATGRFQIDFKAVKAAAQDILLMPTTHVLKVQLPSRRRGTRGRILDPEQNLRLARLEKRISRSSADDGKGGSSEFRAELLQALPDDVNSVMDSNQCKLEVTSHYITSHDMA